MKFTVYTFPTLFGWTPLLPTPVVFLLTLLQVRQGEGWGVRSGRSVPALGLAGSELWCELGLWLSRLQAELEYSALQHSR